MRTFFTLLIVTLSLNCYSQNTFFNSYQVGQYAGGDVVFEESDGYVIAGCTNIENEGYLYLLKTNLQGDSLWTKLFPINTINNFINDYVIDDFGNRILIIRPWFIGNNVYKFDTEWNLTYTGTLNTNSPYRIRIMSDNNYLVAGGEFDQKHVLRKINSETLEVIWESDSIGYAYFETNIRSIIEGNEGEVFLVVNLIPLDPTYGVFDVIHLNSSGEKISNNTFTLCYAGAAKFDNGNLFLITYRGIAHSHYNHLITIDPNYGLINDIDISQNETAYYSFFEDDNKIVLFGSYEKSGSEQWHLIIGCYENNEYSWQIRHGKPMETYELHNVIKTSDNGYLLVGNSKEFPFLLKTNNNGQILGIQEHQVTNNFTLYPNPGKDQIFLKSDNIHDAVQVELYNNNGLIIKTIDSKDSKLSIDIKDLPNGIYNLRIMYKNNVEVHRFIK